MYVDTDLNIYTFCFIPLNVFNYPTDFIFLSSPAEKFVEVKHIDSP